MIRTALSVNTKVALIVWCVFLMVVERVGVILKRKLICLMGIHKYEWRITWKVLGGQGYYECVHCKKIK